MLTQKEKKQYNKGDCVITNRAASRRMYNAKYFFARKKALSGIVPVFKGEPHRFLPIDTEGGEFVFRRREWQLYPTRVPIISFICLMLHVAHVSNKYCCELVCVLEPGLRCMGSWGL